MDETDDLMRYAPIIYPLHPLQSRCQPHSLTRMKQPRFETWLKSSGAISNLPIYQQSVGQHKSLFGFNRLGSNSEPVTSEPVNQ
jgi:hypothetical protein